MGKDVDSLVMRDAMGNVRNQWLQSKGPDAPVLNLWPIPLDATEAVLEFPKQKPISVRFSLR